MLKRSNLLNLIFFLVISIFAPYVSSKGGCLALDQNPEECSKSLEKDLLEELSLSDLIAFQIADPLILLLHFPEYLALKSQIVKDQLLRPPRSV